MCQPAPTDEWRNVTGSVGRLTVSPLSVYKGSAGVPPAHRVGVVVVVGHGKGNRVDGSTGRERPHCVQATADNSGASVDGFSKAHAVGRSTDPQAERPTVRRQQRCVGRRIGRGESGLACGDGMDNTSALFNSCITARVVGRSMDPHAESGLLWPGNISASDQYRQRAACFVWHPKGNNGASGSSDSGDSDDDCGGGN
ncbi:hypothetical protein FA13DRAFT_1719560 [Coprinellus micaceus]|uniref:Uncharacterized protein n=1 Tax=Coprinellus micaceus TaxID=71717 RepID=A0A4Y7SCX7_COPMI|nr:hypothetical protein FA13DRAFT_1719560 [Coprinellus micaceus]